MKAGCDLGLFKLIVDAQEAVSVVELAQKTGAEAKFMSELLPSTTLATLILR